MQPAYDITAIITGHNEGIMAGHSIVSFLHAIRYASDAGLRVEPIAMLDKATPETEAAFGRLAQSGVRLVKCEHGDQGLVRNDAVQMSSGRYIAFLDADDLWSFNWLTSAHAICSAYPGRVIAHPEYNWFFDFSNNILLMADERDPFYDVEFLRFSNYWDALCMAPREAHENHPFCVRDVKGGFAYEDWHWNCETVAAGFRHHVAEDTIIFKRRREDSQTLKASRARVTMRQTPMLRYDWYPDERSSQSVVSLMTSEDNSAELSSLSGQPTSPFVNSPFSRGT